MLLTLTLITVALVVLALAGYLIGIAWALNSARKTVIAIADGLEIVAGNTQPVSLLGGLQVADGHLGRAARVFKLT